MLCVCIGSCTDKDSFKLLFYVADVVTPVASSLKFDKSAQKSIVYDVFVVSVLVSAQKSPIPDACSIGQ